MRRGAREEGGGEKGGRGRRIVRRKVTSAANPAHRLQDTGAERCTRGDTGSKSQTSVPPVLFTCRGMHGCACLGVVMIDGLKKKKEPDLQRCCEKCCSRRGWRTCRTGAPDGFILHFGSIQFLHVCKSRWLLR